MTKTGTNIQARVVLYKAVGQLVLLYGSKIWLVTVVMLKLIEVFHHRLERRIVGMMARRTTIGDWEFPPVAESLDTTVLWPIK